MIWIYFPEYNCTQERPFGSHQLQFTQEYATLQMLALFLKGIVYGRYPPLLLSAGGLGRLHSARRWHIGFVGRTVLDYGTSTHFYEGWGCGMDCVTHTNAVQNRCVRIVGVGVVYKRRAWICLDPS